MVRNTNNQTTLVRKPYLEKRLRQNIVLIIIQLFWNQYYNNCLSRNKLVYKMAKKEINPVGV